MKIKIYIVTYNNNKLLNEWTLTTLFNSDLSKHEVKVYIIDNHSTAKVDDNYKDKVTILHNQLRPDFSTGHLSRNWNQALVNGFESLKEPKCDIVVCSQNDVKFNPNWLNDLVEAHKTYSFITYGQGDCLHSYTPAAVKKIGLWDERYNTIMYQEHDYFLRALIYNREKSSINSRGTGQLLNPLKVELLDIKSAPCGAKRGEKTHAKARKHASTCQRLFKTKWGNIPHARWKKNYDDWVPKHSNIQNFMFYPYFEKDIENLQQKKYFM